MQQLGWRIRVMVAVASVACVAHAAAAQAPRARVTDSIPAEYLPPAGLCRVWLDNVPPAQQPAPVECAIAVRSRPENGRVVYGASANDDRGRSKKDPNKLPPGVKALDGKGTSPFKRPVAQRDDPPRERWEDKRISDASLYGDVAGRETPGSPTRDAGVGVEGGGPPVAAGVVTGAGNVIVGAGGVTDPRYFSGARPPGLASGSCLDRDDDGWCDDFRFGPPACLDRDRDGRCDDLPEFASAAYPQVLPRMRAALDVVQGRGSVEVARWLGTNEFIARLPDGGRGGTPWRVLFLDANSLQLLQVWTDRNRDGLADRVEVFRNGQRVKLLQR
ncbi:MAG: hypothetical protein MUE41_02155 [Gemmatimonadaceae bacterium]|jgi:hypothetical protein|nr:hypothetical protein [Gemmatimonadaceae bacterium]